MESTAWGDRHTPAVFDTEIREGSIWALWRNIAAQDPAFGRPDKSCTHTDKTNYVSVCLRTLDNKVPAYIQQICQRDPFLFDGNIVTGGLVSIRDSNWLLSWNVEREPHFPDQPHDMLLCHFYGANSDRPGNRSPRRCASAPARRSPRNGSTTSGCRPARSPNWPPAPWTASLA